jgi:predicted dehydrogenase
MSAQFSRRRFVKQTAMAAGAAVAPLGAVWSKPIGANDDIRVAIVGFNGHGYGMHMESYLKMPGVRIVALCDPDRTVLAKGVKRLAGINPQVRTFTDIRKLLDEPDIDAISGATPNHWHALSTVWACQAGKHVCVEKPVSHNIWEGRKMVEAAAKYKRLVQADLDLRSSTGRQEAVEYVQGGELGKILMVHAWVYKQRASIGKVSGSGTVPDSVDYDLWCGPAPKGPLPRQKLHYDWHWQWDTGCGEVGNNGPHHLDACRWALGEPGLPRSVFSIGGRFGYDDDGETPNTQLVIYDYASAPILFEVRSFPRTAKAAAMDDFRALSRKGIKLHRACPGAGPHNGNIVVCENGWVDLGTLTVHDLDGKAVRKFTDQEKPNPNLNFIKALRSGKESDLRTGIENGHLSTSICHMGNISHRVGKAASREEANELIGKDEVVLDALGRMQEHLRIHGIKLDQEKLIVGPKLTMDTAAERFTGPWAEQANQFVKRSYREPYVIRDQI